MSKINIIYKLLNRDKTMPFYLIHFITSRCNCNCKHCFNYKRRKNSELSIQEIEKLSKSIGKIYWMGITGGEPFLRDDIDRIVELYSKNAGVKQIKIPTNGSLPEIIYKKSLSMCQKIKKTRITVNLSIDGLNKKHDNIRGYKGLFNKVIKTHQLLIPLTKKFKNFSVASSITISKMNQNNFLETYTFLKKNLKIKNISILLTRGDILDVNKKDVYFKNYSEIISSLEKDTLKNKLGYSKFFESKLINAKSIVQRKLTYDILSKKIQKREFYCSAGNLNAVIYENGDVAPCELLPVIDNLRIYNMDFKRLWFSNKANIARNFIYKKKCLCTHECFLNTSMISNFKFIPQIIKNFFKIR